MFKVLIMTGAAFVVAAAGCIGMYIMDNNSVHKSVAKRQHTHYSRFNVNFEKETCIEFYDNGSWFPVYVCEAN